MPRTAVVAVSRGGAELARTLAPSLGGESHLYLERRFIQADASATAFDLPLRPVLQHLFREYDRLVIFLAVGAAVRLLAPCLEDKRHDPAVVCVDDGGRFAVSLLSGHLGGADALAMEVAGILGATAVITSASHAAGTLAVDLLGREYGWQVEADPVAVTRASAAVVNGQPVGVYQETGEPGWWKEGTPLLENIKVCPTLESLAASGSEAALIITDRLDWADKDVLPGKPVVVYRPRSLAAGMGCRRGVPVEELEGLLLDTLARHNLSHKSLKCIATADLKADEPGMQELAEKYRVPLVCYSADELNGVFMTARQAGGQTGAGEGSLGEIGPTPSAAARRLVGVWGVSEPAALLAAGRGALVVPRQKTARATIAVARINFPGAG